MVKSRMTTVDVAAEVCCLRRLIGMRCANIYDLSPSIYVLKLAKSSGVAESGETERALVVLESGVRLHTTEFSRDKSSTPSAFTLRLRKHLRTSRLENVRQLGIDRVVDFQFGLGDHAHHIILELYGQGNLILTDAACNILQLLRSWKDEEKGRSMMARQRYPIDSCRLLERTTLDKLEGILKSRGLVQTGSTEKSANGNVDLDGKKAKTKWGKASEKKGPRKEAGGLPQQTGASTGLGLKTILGEGFGYGPVLMEHVILDAGLKPDMKIIFDGKHLNIQEVELRTLLESFARFEGWLEAVVGGDRVPEGYIFMRINSSSGKMSSSGRTETENEAGLNFQMYEDFYPLILKQLENCDHVKFSTFDAAMDEFFSKIEGQRAQQQRKSQEDSAVRKLDKIRADQTSRAKALEREVDHSEHRAELIEYNLEDVDAGILAVRTALASGMDWKDLARMIKEEKKAGNPVAGLIHSLQLETNHITLLLSNNLDDMDEEEKTRPVDKVEVDLSLSAHANARRWFETRKKHATKQEKTLAAHEKAFKAAEKKSQQQLAQAKTVAAITHIRKVHWFEKFNWFVTSENFLVISGRDAQQNELLVKRYMKKGDLYVHADLHGASTTIVKNHNAPHPIPPFTINQAGCFTVCRSQAWDSKIVTSAWWVEAHQVSKTAPTGEYLTVGSFMVRGKKNFLPPNPLVMGYGFLFRLDDSCLAAHVNERQVRGEESEDASVIDADQQEDQTLDRQDGGDGDSSSSEYQDTAVTSVASSNLEPVPKEDDRTGAELAVSDSPSGDDGKDVETADGSVLDDILDRNLQLGSAPIAVAGGKSKYALDSWATSDNVSHDRISELLNVSTSAQQRGKPYVSKAERRKLKKGGKQTDHSDQELAEEEAAHEDAQEQVSAEDEKREKSSASQASKPGRGRKGKLKKIKGKYAEQDEDERLLRMELLASAGRKESNVTGENEKDTKGTKNLTTNGEAVSADLQDFSKVCYKCKRSGHVAIDCPNVGSDATEVRSEDAPSEVGNRNLSETDSGENALNLAKQDPAAFKGLGGRKEGMSRRAYAKAAKEEITTIMMEENLLELGEDEKEKLTELDSLTGKPLPSDVLLYAVPVCGPYNALQGFKYRVKLTPGNSKRGKAAKVAVDVFSHLPEASAREKQLIKAVTDPELVACMIGNAKVTAPGLSKLKQSNKKGKKMSLG